MRNTTSKIKEKEEPKTKVESNVGESPFDVNFPPLAIPPKQKEKEEDLFPPLKIELDPEKFPPLKLK